MREVCGEVGEDLVHLLGGGAPGRPEVDYHRRLTPERVVEIRLRSDVLDAAPAATTHLSFVALSLVLLLGIGEGDWREEEEIKARFLRGLTSKDSERERERGGLTLFSMLALPKSVEKLIDRSVTKT